MNNGQPNTIKEYFNNAHEKGYQAYRAQPAIGLISNVDYLIRCFEHGATNYPSRKKFEYMTGGMPNEFYSAAENYFQIPSE